MIKFIFNSLIIFSISIVPTIATASDFYNSYQKSNFEHQIYFSLPLSTVKYSEPLKFGYSFNFKHSKYRSGRNYSVQNFRASLVNIQFSSMKQGRVNLAGAPLLHFNEAGLQFGQDSDNASENGSSNTLLYVIGGLAVLGVLVAVSGTKESCEVSGDSELVGLLEDLDCLDLIELTDR